MASRASNLEQSFSGEEDSAYYIGGNETVSITEEDFLDIEPMMRRDLSQPHHHSTPILSSLERRMGKLETRNQQMVHQLKAVSTRVNDLTNEFHREKSESVRKFRKMQSRAEEEAERQRQAKETLARGRSASLRRQGRREESAERGRPPTTITSSEQRGRATATTTAAGIRSSEMGRSRSTSALGVRNGAPRMKHFELFTKDGKFIPPPPPPSVCYSPGRFPKLKPRSMTLRYKAILDASLHRSRPSRHQNQPPTRNTEPEVSSETPRSSSTRSADGDRTVRQIFDQTTLLVASTPQPLATVGQGQGDGDDPQNNETVVIRRPTQSHLDSLLFTPHPLVSSTPTAAATEPGTPRNSMLRNVLLHNAGKAPVANRRGGPRRVTFEHEDGFLAARSPGSGPAMMMMMSGREKRNGEMETGRSEAIPRAKSLSDLHRPT